MRARFRGILPGGTSGVPAVMPPLSTTFGSTMLHAKHHEALPLVDADRFEA